MSRSYRVHPVVIVAVVSVIVAFVVWVVVQIPKGNSTTPPPVTPTASVAVTAHPSTRTPSMQTSVGLRERIYAFENAWLIADAQSRRTALEPYVTSQYMSTIPEINGTSPAETAQLSLKYVLGSETVFRTEFDGDVMYVTALLAVASMRDGKRVNTFTVPHNTTWVLQNGAWRVFSETETR